MFEVGIVLWFIPFEDFQPVLAVLELSVFPFDEDKGVLILGVELLDVVNFVDT